MIDFKEIEDEFSNFHFIIIEEMRGVSDFQISQEEKELLSKYELYKNTLFSFIYNKDNNEYIEIINQSLCFFCKIADWNFKSLVSRMVNEKVICKIIEIYLQSADYNIMKNCLMAINNFNYLIQDISYFCIPQFAIKLIGSFESPIPELSEISRIAFCNLILHKSFYEILPSTNWYEELIQVKNESLQLCMNEDEEINENEDNKVDANIIFLRLFYALIRNKYESYKIFEHIDHVFELFRRYYIPGSIVENEDTPYFSIRIFASILTPNSYFDKDQIDSILELFNENIIYTISLRLNENENSVLSKFIIEELIEHGVNIEPIFTPALLISLKLPDPNLTKIRINVLSLLKTVFKKDLWNPPQDFIEAFMCIIENGNFEEKKSAILTICEVKNEIIEHFKLYHIFFDFLSNNDESLIIPVLEKIRDLLYYCESFAKYILSNKYDMEELRNFVFNPEISNNEDYKEVVTSINILMKKITSLE